MGDPSSRLRSILGSNPFLNSEHHGLHPYVTTALQAIKDGDNPHDKIDVIQSKLEVEEKTLSAAFKRFCTAGHDCLGKQELARMNSYLGFPSASDEIDHLMQRLDRNRTGTVDFGEFQAYVASMGGSMKLFEERRKRIGGDGTWSSTEELKLSMLESGFSEEAQACWRLVVPPSEFEEVSKLVPCQKRALMHIRDLAKRNHERALPRVQQRVRALGFGDDALWMALAWIRELAPVIIHVDLDKLLPFLERDTQYRNQFETNTSGAALDVEARRRWERGLFSGAYDAAGVRASDRCKYAVLNVMNDHRGVVRCRAYGDSYLIIKDARLRCTCSPEDSAAMKADSLAVFDFYAHVLHEYSDSELRETLTVANSHKAAVLGDSEKVGLMKYKEAQIHGAIRFDKHIDRIVVDPRHRAKEARLRAVCRKHGWAFSWMDEEKRRMEKEDMHKLHSQAWKDRLALLEIGAGGPDAPEGYCQQGCGRRVCPGFTRSGKPFSTCCRGCVMGFGHDLRCGTIDASKVGVGLCKFGCGRRVAPGLDSKGRAFDSCCRGCALGGGHDSTCQRGASAARSGELSPTSPGICKMGCGRPVAPGLSRSGKAFDTCCKTCGSGGPGHDESCGGGSRKQRLVCW